MKHKLIFTTLLAIAIGGNVMAKPLEMTHQVKVERSEMVYGMVKSEMSDYDGEDLKMENVQGKYFITDTVSGGSLELPKPLFTKVNVDYALIDTFCMTIKHARKEAAGDLKNVE